MTAKANDSTQFRSCSSPLVLFGIDSRGKPKGARFGRKNASLAIKAATQLQLNVLASNDPKVAEIAGRLPVGRRPPCGRCGMRWRSPQPATQLAPDRVGRPGRCPRKPRRRLVRSDCDRSQRRHADVALARLPETTTYRTPPSPGRAPLPGTTIGWPSQQTSQANRSSKSKRCSSHRKSWRGVQAPVAGLRRRATDHAATVSVGTDLP